MSSITTNSTTAMMHMPTAVELWESNDPTVWLAQYSAITDTSLSQSTIYKERLNKLNKPKLTELDSWLTNELPRIVRARNPPHLINSELSKIMQWKLLFGKYRPKLQSLIDNNKNELVIDCTSRAFELVLNNKQSAKSIFSLSTIKTAVSILTELSGVGAATASAILVLIDPYIYPYMNDPAVSSMPNNGLIKLNYTIKQYLAFITEIESKVRQLNQSKLPYNSFKFPVEWTADLVSKVLWSADIQFKTIKTATVTTTTTTTNNNNSKLTGNKRKPESTELAAAQQQ